MDQFRPTPTRSVFALLTLFPGSILTRKALLYLGGALKRDKYLSTLGRRIDHFKDRQSSSLTRVSDDDVDEESLLGDYAVPEVDATALDSHALHRAIRQNGCLIVRNFFSANEVKDMRTYVDYSVSLHSNKDSAISRYLTKSVNLDEVLKNTVEDIRVKQQENSTYFNTVKMARNFSQALGKHNSFFVARTPLLTEKILQLFTKTHLKKLLSKYFKNDPCLSIYKWVIRKSQPPKNIIDFHQDGAFMGDDIATPNCWIPLSDCGTGYSVHGLDVIPVPLKHLFSKGSGVLDWTISAQAVTDKYGESAIVTPTFRKGDAFFFDQFLMHRSQYLADSSESRYAIENWFFDSKYFPKNQVPLKW